MIDSHAAYQALISRDTRFDGVFYVGVTSTRIYCRTVCPVKAPLPQNCRFFTCAEAAEKAGFRPCLRCRPELAPGNAPIDRAHRITDRVVAAIDEGLLQGKDRLEQIAACFHISGRQLRRVLQKELGVSPIELKQTRRLLLAKQLLTETQLPVTDVAFASGFTSLRRFHAAFQQRYQLPPGRLRKHSKHDTKIQNRESSTLQLSYRPPYAWQEMLAFLAQRAIQHVEAVENDSYLRTVRLNGSQGWIRATQVATKNALKIEFSHSLLGVLPVLLRRLRNLFDLNAHPDRIIARLQHDPYLADSIAAYPGLRVPGAFDNFEMIMRAILGQQITVKAATTLAGRLSLAFGDEIHTPFPTLTRLSPQPEMISMATVDEVAASGIISARARCIIRLAQACTKGELLLNEHPDPEQAIKKLLMLPGIGSWTAHYIAMRALRWPDAFPKEDIVIRNNLGGITAKEAEQLSLAWSPWRSYAVMHIWHSLSNKK
ncbi:AlkA N-terminal domain-containing protein [Enterobacteriaceae bacterium LUAb1]